MFLHKQIANQTAFIVS